MSHECLRDCDVPMALTGGVMRGAFPSFGKAKLEARDPPFTVSFLHSEIAVAAWCLGDPFILVEQGRDDRHSRSRLLFFLLAVVG